MSKIILFTNGVQKRGVNAPLKFEIWKTYPPLLHPIIVSHPPLWVTVHATACFEVVQLLCNHVMYVRPNDSSIHPSDIQIKMYILADSTIINKLVIATLYMNIIIPV